MSINNAPAWGKIVHFELDENDSVEDNYERWLGCANRERRYHGEEQLEKGEKSWERFLEMYHERISHSYKVTKNGTLEDWLVIE